jgi:hypothetical protein
MDDRNNPRLASAVQRLADEFGDIKRDVEEARRDLDGVAECVRDLSAAVNAHLRVLDRDAVGTAGRFNELMSAIGKTREALESLDRKSRIDVSDLVAQMSPQELADLAPKSLLDGARRIAYLGRDGTGQWPVREPTGQHALMRDPSGVFQLPAPPPPALPPAPPEDGLVWNLGGKSIPVGKAGWWLLKNALPAGAIGTGLHFLLELLHRHASQ